MTSNKTKKLTRAKKEQMEANRRLYLQKITKNRYTRMPLSAKYIIFGNKFENPPTITKRLCTAIKAFIIIMRDMELMILETRKKGKVERIEEWI